MTPISDLVASIVARVLASSDLPSREADRARRRQAPEPTPPVPEDSDLAQQAEAWAEPEPGE